jgi:hypothetical protein
MVGISILSIYVAVKILVHKYPVKLAIVAAEISPECGAGSDY